VLWKWSKNSQTRYQLLEQSFNPNGVLKIRFNWSVTRKRVSTSFKKPGNYSEAEYAPALGYRFLRIGQNHPDDPVGAT
jgi:hypothetical protein